MNCPVCYSFAQAVDGVTQVNGTIYCAAHGVEALNFNNGMSGPGGPRGPMNRRPPVFTPPVPAAAAEPTPEPAPAPPGE